SAPPGDEARPGLLPPAHDPDHARPRRAQGVSGAGRRQAARHRRPAKRRRLPGRGPTVSSAGRAPAVAPDEPRLRHVLERLLSRAEGRPVTVAAVTRTPSPFASLFPAEVLTVSLRGGGELSLFVKHLGPEQADHPEKQCREREPRVYERLLEGEGLPAPRYFGSCRNEATGRREV